MSAGLVFAGILSSLLSLTSLVCLVMISIHTRRQWKIMKEMRDLRLGQHQTQIQQRRFYQDPQT